MYSPDVIIQTSGMLVLFWALSAAERRSVSGADAIWVLDVSMALEYDCGKMAPLLRRIGDCNIHETVMCSEFNLNF